MEESSVLRIADGLTASRTRLGVRSAAQPRAARRSQIGCGALVGAAARGASSAASRYFSY